MIYNNNSTITYSFHSHTQMHDDRKYFLSIKFFNYFSHLILYGRLFDSIEPLSMLKKIKTFLWGVKLFELIIVHMIINYNLLKLLTNVTGRTIAVRGQTRLASSIENVHKDSKVIIYIHCSTYDHGKKIPNC